jgi:hypothetical protein
MSFSFEAIAVWGLVTRDREKKKAVWKRWLVRRKDDANGLLRK